MKEIIISTQFTVFEDAEDMPTDVQDLMNRL
jgi:hypothetical protein